MALTTVAELRTTLGVGSLYPDATLQEVCDAADAVLLPMLAANTAFIVGHSNTTSTGTSYFHEDISKKFLVGQTVNISGAGSKHNGNKTLTVVNRYDITYAITGNNNTPTDFHTVSPYGKVTGDTYTDWTIDAAVQTAALEIAVDIFQSRQVSSTGGTSPDFSPSPYRMGNTLLARVRGLIAHALDSRSMVG